MELNQYNPIPVHLDFHVDPKPLNLDDVVNGNSIKFEFELLGVAGFVVCENGMDVVYRYLKEDPQTAYRSYMDPLRAMYYSNQQHRDK